MCVCVRVSVFVCICVCVCMCGAVRFFDLNMLSFCPELLALAESTGQAVAAANMEDVAEALCN